MTLISRLPQKFLSLLLGASMLLTLFQPLSVQAQEDGLRRGRDPQTGLLTFLGADPAKPYRLPSAMQAGLLADQRAHALLELFAPEFGITNPGRDLRLAREKAGEDGQSSLRYQQVFQDIPVMGGELVVNTTAEGALLSMSGEASLVRDLITQPAIGREQARAAALQLMQRNYSAQPSEFELTEPQLWILDERLLRPSSQPPVLVWRLEASLLEGPVRELILVNALDGGIPLHFNQIDTAWTSRGGKPASFARPALPDRLPSRSLVAGTPLYSTYDLNHGTTLPGTLKCTEANPTCSGAVLDAQWAHFLAADAYDFYYTQHGRDSLDNHGLRIKSTVRYKVNYDNAFWNGTQMAYGDAYGFVFADDVVGHELTHGVTDYESDLFYYYQSGAINESFSDVWGEAFDQLNGVGTDDLASKWYIGEDVSGYGALRHMSNPGLYGDPDRILSANYFTGSDDNGGVHYNSGVNNKAVTLMVDGGSFNGQTVAALGWTKVLAIYYEVQANLLTSGSDYLDLHNALYQGCLNKVGKVGISLTDCTQVRNATLAVEMNQQPFAGYNPEAGPLCPAGRNPLNLYVDNFESGTDGWLLQTGWLYDTGNTSSGTHMLWANDHLTGANTAAISKNVKIPAGSISYLVFDHSYGFEAETYLGTYYAYDGGVLEYAVNNGPWKDAKPLFTSGKNYNGTISAYAGTVNPLAGRQGFVDESRGYVSSQYNLSTLAGSNVRFRWRMGTDELGYNYGWSVDDVRIYSCIAKPNKPSLISPANGAKLTDYSPVFDWSNSTPSLAYYQLQIATDSGFTSIVYSRSNIGVSNFTLPVNLAIGQTFYWRVRAFNALGLTKGWTLPFSFSTVPGKPTLLSPAAGEQLVNNLPTFDWSNVAGATSYTIQIASDSTFTTILISKVRPGSVYTPASALPANTTLYWRVRANSAAGSGQWSAPRTFDTAP